MNYRGLLLDLDGVFHVGDQLLPGAVDALEMLRARRVPFRIVTNTTTRSRSSLAEKMRRIGLPIVTGDMITATYAALLYLRSLRSLESPRCRFVMTDDARSEFSEMRDYDDNPEYVVLGDIEEQATYSLLNSIFNQMMAGAQLIALHKGRYWQVPEGLKVDLGLFVAGLEYTTGKKATVIGKPEPLIFQMALTELGLKPLECAMIGDDLYNDVAGAQNAGIAGVLIKTGKYRPNQKPDQKITPDRTLNSLFELEALLETAR